MDKMMDSISVLNKKQSEKLENHIDKIIKDQNDKWFNGFYKREWAESKLHEYLNLNSKYENGKLTDKSIIGQTEKTQRLAKELLIDCNEAIIALNNM